MMSLRRRIAIYILSALTILALALGLVFAAGCSLSTEGKSKAKDDGDVETTSTSTHSSACKPFSSVMTFDTSNSVFWYMTADITGTLVVESGRPEIDLHGHTLYGNIVVKDGAELLLIDCSSDHSGKISGGTGYKVGSYTYGGGIYVGNNSLLYMQTGNVCNCSANIGGAIYVGKNSSFWIGDDVYIYNNTTTCPASTSYGYAGAVVCEGCSDVEMFNMSVYNNTGKCSSSSTAYGGAGIVFKDCGDVHLHDGVSIYGNSSGGFYGGAGIYLFDSTATIEDTKIYNNSVTSGYAGGVMASGSTVTFSNCEIYSNTAECGGGGVYVLGSGSSATLTDCNIHDNSVTTSSGGIGGGLAIDSKCTAELKGSTTLKGNKASMGGGVYIYAGTLKMAASGSSITGNTATAEGGGIYMYSGSSNAATLTMSAGTISNNTAAGSGGGISAATGASITLSGGSITGNTITAQESYGAGICLQGNATCTMSGGSITSNSSGSVKYTYGGGVAAIDSSTFTLKSGTIDSNTAYYDGGGLYVESTATISGGTISNNKCTVSSGKGGGICIESGGAVTMSAGTISGNQCTSSGYGAGMYIDSKGTFTMSGGSITDNYAIYWGGIMCHGTMNLSGTAYIYGNTDKNLGGGSDIQVYDATINLTGNFKSGAKIGLAFTDSALSGISGYLKITSGESGTKYYQSNYSYFCFSANGSLTYQGYEIYSDSTNSCVSVFAPNYNGDAYVVSSSGTTTYYETVAEALAAAEGTSSSKAGTVYLNHDATLTSTYSVNGYVTLDLNGCSLTCTATRAFYVYGNLTLKDSTESAYTSVSSGTEGVKSAYTTDEDGNRHTTYTVTYAKDTSTGTAVGSKAYYTYTAGAIYGLSTSSSTVYGDAVYVSAGGTFNMYGGIFTENSSSAGVISVGGNTTSTTYSYFSMYGGCISGNTASSSYGIVHLGTYSKSYVYAGVISSNSSYACGGIAVYADTSYLYFGNTSSYAASCGALVSGNSTTSGGSGGIYVRSGTMYMYGGEISGNTAKTYGGGIYVPQSGTLNMSGGKIVGNKTESSGYFYAGGVYIQGALDLSGDAVIRWNSYTPSSGTADSNLVIYSNSNGAYINGSFTGYIGIGGMNTNTRQLTSKRSGGSSYTLSWLQAHVFSDCTECLGVVDGNYIWQYAEHDFTSSDAVTLTRSGNNFVVTCACSHCEEPGDASQFTVKFKVENGVEYAYVETDDDPVMLAISGGFMVTDSGGNMSWYSSISDALNKLSDGDTITLFENVSTNLNVNYSVTIDLNGYSVNATITAIDSSVSITDGSEDKSGYVSGLQNSNATMTLSGGTYKVNVLTRSGVSIAEGYTILVTADGYYVVTDPTTAQKTATVSVMVNGATYYFESVDDAISYANGLSESATITLLDDVSVSSSVSISGTNITIDLNGKTLSGNVTVGENATLTVSGSGSLSASLNVNASGEIDVEATGTITVTPASGSSISGEIEITSGTATVNLNGNSVGALTVDSSATATVDLAGSTITTLTVESSATATVNDSSSGSGTITNISDSGSLKIQGGSYDASQIAQVYEDLGSGYYIYYDGSSYKVVDSISSATVSLTYTASDGTQVTVYFDSIDDAVSHASDFGGNVTITLLKDTSASSVSITGSNITIDLDGHTLSGNVTVSSGVALKVSGDGTLNVGASNVSGEIEIVSGTVTVDLNGNTVGTLIVDSSVSVTVKDSSSGNSGTITTISDTGTLKIQGGSYLASQIEQVYEDLGSGYYIYYDGANYKVVNSVSSAAVSLTYTVNGTQVTVYFDSIDDAVTYAETLEVDVKITLEKDVAASSVSITGSNITIDLNGKTLSGNVTVASGASLTVSGSGSLSASLNVDANGEIDVAATGSGIAVTPASGSTVSGEIEIVSGSVTVDLNGTTVGKLTVDSSASVTVKDSSSGNSGSITTISPENISSETLSVTGGSYTKDQIEQIYDCIAEDYVVYSDGSGSYKVVKKSDVSSAAVSMTYNDEAGEDITIYFASIDDAVDYAETLSGGVTITLENDAVASNVSVTGSNITIDLNNHTLSGNVTVSSGATLTVSGEGNLSATLTVNATGEIDVAATGDGITVTLGSSSSVSGKIEVTSGTVTVDLNANTLEGTLTVGASATSVTLTDSSSANSGSVATISPENITSDTLSVTGGSYTKDQIEQIYGCIAEGYVVYSDGENYKVVQESDVSSAAVSLTYTDSGDNEITIYFASIDDAVTYAQTLSGGVTITLENDATASSVSVTGSSITIDLNGKTLSGNVTVTGSDAELEITGSGKVDATVTVESNGELTISADANGSGIEITLDSGSSVSSLQITSGTVTIDLNGGSIGSLTVGDEVASTVANVTVVDTSADNSGTIWSMTVNQAEGQAEDNLNTLEIQGGTYTAEQVEEIYGYLDTNEYAILYVSSANSGEGGYTVVTGSEAVAKAEVSLTYTTDNGDITIYFDSINAAVTYAESLEAEVTITLLDDVTDSDFEISSSNITIDLDSNTLGGSFIVKEGAELEITGSGEVDATITVADASSGTAGKLTISAGEGGIEVTLEDGSDFKGEMEITNGAVTVDLNGESIGSLIVGDANTDTVATVTMIDTSDDNSGTIGKIEVKTEAEQTSENTLEIQGGTYTAEQVEDVYGYLDTDEYAILYDSSANGGDGGYTVVEKATAEDKAKATMTYTSSEGVELTVYFDTVDEAVSYANDLTDVQEALITLEDYADDSNINVTGTNITVDLNGYELNGSIIIGEGASLTVTGEGGMDAAFDVEENGTFTIAADGKGIDVTLEDESDFEGEMEITSGAVTVDLNGNGIGTLTVGDEDSSTVANVTVTDTSSSDSGTIGKIEVKSEEQTEPNTLTIEGGAYTDAQIEQIYDASDISIADGYAVYNDSTQGSEENDACFKVVSESSINGDGEDENKAAASVTYTDKEGKEITVYFADAQEAADYASSRTSEEGSNVSITLLGDVEDTLQISDGTITLDLNGHSISSLTIGDNTTGEPKTTATVTVIDSSAEDAVAGTGYVGTFDVETDNTLIVQGGTYGMDVSNYIDENCTIIYGGLDEDGDFSSFLVVNKENADEIAAAKVEITDSETKYFASAWEALEYVADNAEEGVTLVLLADADISSEEVTISGSVTIDLNGHTLVANIVIEADATDEGNEPETTPGVGGSLHVKDASENGGGSVQGKIAVVGTSTDNSEDTNTYSSTIIFEGVTGNRYLTFDFSSLTNAAEDGSLVYSFGLSDTLTNAASDGNSYYGIIYNHTTHTYDIPIWVRQDDGTYTLTFMCSCGVVETECVCSGDGSCECEDCTCGGDGECSCDINADCRADKVYGDDETEKEKFTTQYVYDESTNTVTVEVTYTFDETDDHYSLYPENGIIEYEVASFTPIARIALNDEESYIYFETIEEAVAYVETLDGKSATIVLMGDVDSMAIADGTYTVDLNGHTIGELVVGDSDAETTATVTVTDSSSDNSGTIENIEVNQAVDQESQNTLSIEAGTYEKEIVNDVSENLGSGFAILYDADSDSYKVVDSDTGLSDATVSVTYTINDGTEEGHVVEIYFESINDAIAYAESLAGEGTEVTITLQQDIESCDIEITTDNITIDLNGKELGGSMTIDNDAVLTVTGSGEIDAVIDIAAEDTRNSKDAGKLVIAADDATDGEGGIEITLGEGSSMSGAIEVSSGDVTIDLGGNTLGGEVEIDNDSTLTVTGSGSVNAVFDVAGETEEGNDAGKLIIAADSDEEYGTGIDVTLEEGSEFAGEMEITSGDVTVDLNGNEIGSLAVGDDNSETTANVTITDSSSDNSGSIGSIVVSQAEEQGTESPNTLDIEGGSYSADNIEDVSANLADGSALYYDPDTQSYEVVNENTVTDAKVSLTYETDDGQEIEIFFDSIDDAVKYAESLVDETSESPAVTITLQDDIDDCNIEISSNNITIDLNGKELGGNIKIDNDSTLTITGNGVVDATFDVAAATEDGDAKDAGKLVIEADESGIEIALGEESTFTGEMEITSGNVKVDLNGNDIGTLAVGDGEDEVTSANVTVTDTSDGNSGTIENIDTSNMEDGDSLAIEGGTYSAEQIEQISEYMDENNYAIVYTPADGDPDEEGTFTVVETSDVSGCDVSLTYTTEDDQEITIYFDDIADAVSYAESLVDEETGEGPAVTITLQDSIEDCAIEISSDNITIDLNGNELSGNIKIDNDSTLTVTGSGEIDATFDVAGETTEGTETKGAGKLIIEADENDEEDETKNGITVTLEDGSEFAGEMNVTSGDVMVDLGGNELGSLVVGDTDSDTTANVTIVDSGDEDGNSGTIGNIDTTNMGDGDSLAIDGGTYSADQIEQIYEYMDEDSYAIVYAPADDDSDEDGTFTVVEASKVTDCDVSLTYTVEDGEGNNQEITIYFDDIEDAIEYAETLKEDVTITLQDDIESCEIEISSDNITIDLGGNELSGNITIDSGSTLTVTGEGSVDATFDVEETGKLIIAADESGDGIDVKIESDDESTFAGEMDVTSGDVTVDLNGNDIGTLVVGDESNEDTTSNVTVTDTSEGNSGTIGTIETSTMGEGDTLLIEGGTYSAEQIEQIYEYMDEDDYAIVYTPDEDTEGEGTFTVVKESEVSECEVSLTYTTDDDQEITIYFDDIADAVEYAETLAEDNIEVKITLQDDISECEIEITTDNITIDLGGYELEGDISIAEDSTLTVTGEGSVDATFDVDETGKLIIAADEEGDGIDVKLESDEDSAFAGEMEITSGDVTVDLNGNDIGTLIVGDEGNNETSANVTVTDSSEGNSGTIGTIKTSSMGEEDSLAFEGGSYSAEQVVQIYENLDDGYAIKYDPNGGESGEGAFAVVEKSETSDCDVSLTYTGKDSEGNDQEITIYFEDIADAVDYAETLANEDIEVKITLQDNIEDCDIEISSGNITIDLGGHELEGDISIAEDSTLTVTGEGSVDATFDVEETGKLIIAADEEGDGIDVKLESDEESTFEGEIEITSGDVTVDLGGNELGTLVVGDENSDTTTNVTIVDSGDKNGNSGTIDSIDTSNMGDGESLAIQGGEYREDQTEDIFENLGDDYAILYDPEANGGEGAYAVVTEDEAKDNAAASVTVETEGGESKVYFDDLDDAISYAEDMAKESGTSSTTITLLEDVTEEEYPDGMTITDGDITVDLNGHSVDELTVGDGETGTTADVTIVDSSDDNSGTIESIEVQDDDSLSIQGGTYDSLEDIADYIDEEDSFTYILGTDENGDDTYYVTSVEEAEKIAAASVTADDDKTYYFDSFEAAIEFVNENELSGATVTLLRDDEAGSEIAISVEGVTIDLNGNTLIADVTVSDGGTLTIEDSSDAGSGMVKGNIGDEDTEGITIIGGTYTEDVSRYLDDDLYLLVGDDGEGNLTYKVVDENGLGTASVMIEDEDGKERFYSSAVAAFLDASDGDTIIILDDLEEDVTLSANGNVTFDLNGHTLDGSVTVGSASQSAILTIVDSSFALTIEGEGDDEAVTGAACGTGEITGEISNNKYSSTVISGGAYTFDPRYVTDADVSLATGYVVMISEGEDGETIYVAVEERYAEYVAVATVTVETAGGEETFYFGSIEEAVKYAEGAASSGDAEVTVTLLQDVESMEITSGDITVDLNGQTIGELTVGDNDSSTTANVVVVDSTNCGTIESAELNNGSGDESTLSIEGGTYSKPDESGISEYVPDGYVLVNDGSDNYMVAPLDDIESFAQASVTDSDGETHYFTDFDDALSYVLENGGTLTIYTDIDVYDDDDPIKIADDVTIDLNGHTLVANIEVETSEGGSLTVTDSSEGNSGKIEGTISVDEGAGDYSSSLVFDGGVTPSENLDIDLSSLGTDSQTEENTYVFSETGTSGGDATYGIVKAADHDHSYNIAVWERDGEKIIIKVMCACGDYYEETVYDETAGAEVAVDSFTADAANVSYTDNGDGTVTVTASVTVDGTTYRYSETFAPIVSVTATVDGRRTTVYFDDLESAVEYAAANNGYMTLLADIEEDIEIASGNLSVDLNGHEISGDITLGDGESNSASLTIVDSSSGQESGYVSGNVTVNEGSSLSLMAGTYSSDSFERDEILGYVASGYVAVQRAAGEDGTYVYYVTTASDAEFVSEAAVESDAGTLYFESFDDAIAYAEGLVEAGEDATIVLYKDIEEALAFSSGNYTLDLNGNYIYGDIVVGDGEGNTDATLTIVDSDEDKTGTVTGNLSTTSNGENKIILEGGTYTENILETDGVEIGEGFVVLVNGEEDQSGDKTYTYTVTDEDTAENMAAASVTYEDEEGKEQTVYFEDIDDAIEYAEETSESLGENESVTVTLWDDVDEIEFASGDYTLDLNGHSVDNLVVGDDNEDTSANVAITDSSDGDGYVGDLEVKQAEEQAEGAENSVTIEGGSFGSDILSDESIETGEDVFVFVGEEDDEENRTYTVTDSDTAEDMAAASVTYTDEDGNEHTVYFEDIDDAISYAEDVSDASDESVSVTLLEDADDIVIADGDITLDLNGHSVDSLTIGDDNPDTSASVTVTDSSSDNSGYVGEIVVSQADGQSVENELAIEGGTYGQNVEDYIDDGYAMIFGTDGDGDPTFTVASLDEIEDMAAAKVTSEDGEDVYYASLEDAVEYAAESGGTVTLLDDGELSIRISDELSSTEDFVEIEIDLNGHTLDANITLDAETGSLEITDSSDDGSGNGTGKVEGTISVITTGALGDDYSETLVFDGTAPNADLDIDLSGLGTTETEVGSGEYENMYVFEDMGDGTYAIADKESHTHSYTIEVWTRDGEKVTLRLMCACGDYYEDASENSTFLADVSYDDALLSTDGTVEITATVTVDGTTYTYTETIEAVASVEASDGSTIYFDDLQDAVNYAQSEDAAVTLLTDVDEDIVTTENVTIDLNGNALSGFLDVESGTTTIIDSTGTISMDCDVTVESGAELVIGSEDGTTELDISGSITVEDEGTLEIIGSGEIGAELEIEGTMEIEAGDKGVEISGNVILSGGEIDASGNLSIIEEIIATEGTENRIGGENADLTISGSITVEEDATLTIDGSGEISSALDVEDGGTLEIIGDGDGITLEIEEDTVLAGTLALEGDVTVALNGNDLDAAIDIADGSDITLDGQGGTIKLEDDLETDGSSITIASDTGINLNGNTMSVETEEGEYGITVEEGTLSVSDSARGGKIETDILVESGAEIELRDDVIDGYTSGHGEADDYTVTFEDENNLLASAADEFGNIYYETTTNAEHIQTGCNYDFVEVESFDASTCTLTLRFYCLCGETWTETFHVEESEYTAYAAGSGSDEHVEVDIEKTVTVSNSLSGVSYTYKIEYEADIEMYTEGQKDKDSYSDPNYIYEYNPANCFETGSHVYIYKDEYTGVKVTVEIPKTHDAVAYTYSYTISGVTYTVTYYVCSTCNAILFTLDGGYTGDEDGIFETDDILNYGSEKDLKEDLDNYAEYEEAKNDILESIEESMTGHMSDIGYVSDVYERTLGRLDNAVYEWQTGSSEEREAYMEEIMGLLDELQEDAEYDMNIAISQGLLEGDLQSFYDELIASGNYPEDSDMLVQLDELFKEAKAGIGDLNFPSGSTQEEIEEITRQYLARIMELMYKIKLYNLSSGGEYVKGEVSNDSGFDGDSTLVIKETATFDLDDLLGSDGFTYVSMETGETLTDEEIEALFDGMSILAGYSVSLMGSGDVEITSYNGVYTIKIALPDDLASREDGLSIVYISNDGTIEVYAATIEDGYIVFQTTHFSNYYIVGEKIGDYSSAITFLGIVLIIELILAGVLLSIYFAKKGVTGGSKVLWIVLYALVAAAGIAFAISVMVLSVSLSAVVIFSILVAAMLVADIMILYLALDAYSQDADEAALAQESAK